MISGESAMTRSCLCALWQVAVGPWRPRPLRTHDAPRLGVKVRFDLDHSKGPAMRESEFDKINAVLDRAQYAIQQIQRKVDELARKKAAAQTLEEIAAVDLMADELLLKLRKVSDAIHTGNPAPHLRLVSDME
jgi:hypothetical protein